MKEINDEDLQRLIEQQIKGNATIDDDLTEDEQAYLLLFDVLTKEPEIAADSRLADQVFNCIAAQQAKAESLRYNLVLWLLSCGALLFTIIALFILSPVTITLVAANANILLFVVGAVLIIEYADKKLLRRNLI